MTEGRTFDDGYPEPQLHAALIVTFFVYTTEDDLFNLMRRMESLDGSVIYVSGSSTFVLN